MNRARTVILLALACVAAGAARGQEWRGPASLAVEVKGKPSGSVEGALVILRYQQMTPPAGPRPVLTDTAGRAVVADLAPGVWEVEVSHEDFLSFVAIVVLDGGRKPTVQASFLEASGSSLTPIRVKFTSGRGRTPSASVPLPPEAAARLAARQPPPLPEPPAPEPPTRRSSDRRPPEPVMPEPELRPLPSTAQPAPVPAPPEPTAPVPAPPEPTAPEPGAPAPSEAAPRNQPATAAAPPAVAVAPERAEEVRPASTPPAEPPTAAVPRENTAPSAPATETPPPPEPEAPPAPTPPPSATPEPSTPAEPAAPPAPAPEPMPAAPAPTEPQPVPPPEPAPPAPAPARAPQQQPAPTAAPAPPPETAPPLAEAKPQPTPTPAVPTPEPDAAILPPPGPLGPTLRAYRDRTCVECRPGEWALSVETVAGPSAGPCDEAALAADGATLAELLGGSIALELKEIAAPAPEALDDMEASDAATRAAELLGDASSSCRLVAVVIPKAGRFRGLRMEAADASGIGDCQADRDCPVGRARWLGQPRVSREPSANVIWGLFVNQAPDRARRARLTVYFAAPYRAWDPTR